MRLGRSFVAVSMLVVVLTALASCGNETVQRACPEGACPPAEATGHVAHGWSVHRFLDLLVLVDDSQAAAASSERWAALWPDLAARLESPEDRISLHVAALSGTGCAHPRPCADDGSSYLSSTVCGTARNFHGPLAEAMACAASLPATTCSEARPLEQLQHLAETAGAPDGALLRPDAFLAVLILAGTDDASAIDPILAAEALRAARPDPSKLLLIVAGPGDCEGAPLPAAPRLASAVEALGGAYFPTCSSSWEKQVLNLFVDLRREEAPFCLGPLRDLDPSQPGLQPLLRAEDESFSEDGAWSRGELASCATSAPPCWSWAPSPRCLPPQGLFTVVRPEGFCPGLVHTVVDFLTCARPDDPACAVGP